MTRADFLHQGYETPEEAFDLAPEVAAEKETPMPPNEPMPFTDEDRARVEKMQEASEQLGKSSMLAAPAARKDADSLTRALAYITYLEGALGAADKVSEAVDQFSILAGMFDPEKSRAVHANDHYRSARAALPTSKED